MAHLEREGLARLTAKNDGRDGSPQYSPRKTEREPRYEPRDPAFGPGTVSAYDT